MEFSHTGAELLTGLPKVGVKLMNSMALFSWHTAVFQLITDEGGGYVTPQTSNT